VTTPPTPLTETEIAAIDARFNAGEDVWMWCLHHEQHFEKLTEPLSNRINYVKNNKAVVEIPIRLSEIQPVKNVSALLRLQKAYDAAMAEAEAPILALHRSEYPGTRWNGKSIFEKEHKTMTTAPLFQEPKTKRGDDLLMIRAFSGIAMLCVVAIISGAPSWVIYLGACAATVVVLIKEPKQ